MIYLDLIRRFWKPLLGTVAVVTVLFAVWTDGKMREREKWEAKEAKAEKAISEKKVEQAEKTVEIVTKYVDRVQVVKEKGQTIIKEVPVYVQNDADLSGGFRVFHDAAASNELPDATRITNAPTVPIEDAATTVAENYQRCHENAEQLVTLQNWVVKTK